MTIAACYVCPEGVVLGADSTTTFGGGVTGGHPGHFNFSRLDPVCGGPIEVAVITTARRFRWVCHKELDAALA